MKVSDVYPAGKEFIYKEICYTVYYVCNPCLSFYAKNGNDEFYFKLDKKLNILNFRKKSLNMRLKNECNL